jgi:hypothetical protein
MIDQIPATLYSLYSFASPSTACDLCDLCKCLSFVGVPDGI